MCILLAKTVHLSSDAPDMEITDSGIENLDDSYWVTSVDGDLVLVSKNRGVTIYFSNTADAPICNPNLPSLSITDIVSEKLNVSIYPNPVNTKLYINADSRKLSITLYDLKGAKVQKLNAIDGNSVLDFSNFANGVYLLRIETTEGVVAVEKVVIQHN